MISISKLFLHKIRLYQSIVFPFYKTLRIIWNVTCQLEMIYQCTLKKNKGGCWSVSIHVVLLLFSKYYNFRKYQRQKGENSTFISKEKENKSSDELHVAIKILNF